LATADIDAVITRHSERPLMGWSGRAPAPPAI